MAEASPHLRKAVSTFIAQELARRYQADPSAADWRRFGRLPGFTNCKPKHRQANGLFPFVLFAVVPESHSRGQRHSAWK